ncbi:MAG: hypothetical protein F2624_02835 [Actinobacteria bacterium]|uniref:Unannotated protein n=1 Tax=freshwater metagenome TaxID=449393 RepID=A0A6J6K209_9ZZZZ|nr:hypothetical protein [Actinomycetota bacterium]
MNESLVVFVILATLAASYLWIYPKYAGNDVKKMAWLDFALGFIPLGTSAILFWESDPTFRFIFFDTNWFFFTLLALTLLELPLFFWYLKARGLGRAYWQLMVGSSGSQGSGWETATVKSVEKQLNDTQWDGLRTKGAKIFLLVATNVSLLAGTVFLVVVGDNGWTALSLIYILLLFTFWFLLRKSVRLVADAPEEALDERLIQIRDRSYVIAYRWLSMLAILLAIGLLGFSIYTDSQPESDGFSYNIPLTWPQVQAIFWLIFAYTAMLPSMAVIGQELSKRGTK